MTAAENLYAELSRSVRHAQVRQHLIDAFAAEVRAAALREAADLAHAEGNRLYDDMGQKAAAGAWAVRDRLRARADEISRHSAPAGGEQA